MKLKFTAITLCAMLLAEIAHASDVVIFDAGKNIGTPSTKVPRPDTKKGSVMDRTFISCSVVGRARFERATLCLKGRYSTD